MLNPGLAENPMSVTFELDRLEWTSDGRVEVAGRWFGIRGRRILRPVLEVEADGRRHRLLALLEHKPWEATDGGEWVAAFPWDGGPVNPTAAELAVGPDLSVELIAQPEPVSPPSRAAPPQPSPAPPSPEPVERELTAARRHAKRLRDELDRARAAQAAEAEQLRAESAESERRLQDLVRERDAAIAAVEEATRLRDEALRARAAFQRERDSAV